MKEIKNNCYKGTKILLGNQKHNYLNTCAVGLIRSGFIKIEIPIINPYSTFENKVGPENNNMMYRFTDRGDRDICLAPEYTSVIQSLSENYFKNNKDIKLFYIQQCFRGEKPQAGRYREFTQLGVEILNPTKDWTEELIFLADGLIKNWNSNIKTNINRNTSRGLSFYNEDKGFEISCDLLGSSKQICGGGSYKDGVGFALGIDRIIIL